MWIKEVSPELVAAVAKVWKKEGAAALGWVHTTLVSRINEYFDAAGRGSVSEWMSQNHHIYVFKPRKAGHGQMTCEIGFDTSREWGLRITPEYRLSEDRQSHEIKMRWATKAQANNTLRTEVQNFYAANGAP